MTEPIRIPAKTLGELALPDFCPRCFWTKHRLHQNLPFQMFPGIFSSLDAYTKRVVHNWFDRHGVPPTWLGVVGDVTGYVQPPHASRYQFVHQDTNILLTGSPDGLFTRRDGSYIIVDYKTARYTEGQDELLPMYEAQLNAYAVIRENCGFAPVSGLVLLYMEPVTGDQAAAAEANQRDDGFAMNFSARLHTVAVDTSNILRLLAQAWQIGDLEVRPTGRAGCGDCSLLEELVKVSRVPGERSS